MDQSNDIKTPERKTRRRKKDPLNGVISAVKNNEVDQLTAKMREGGHLLELFRERLLESRVGADRSPQVVAVLSNSFEAFRHLLDNYEVNLEQKTSAVIESGYPVKGATPLWTASTLGRLQFVRVLVERGADIEHTTDCHSTPLLSAAFEGHCDVCEFLIDRGADIDKANHVGQSPLTIAAARKKTECVELLIEKGANVKHRGHNARLRGVGLRQDRRDSREGRRQERP